MLMSIGDEKTRVRPSADFPSRSRYVIAGGYRIHYVEAGEGDPVLFIHGNPTSSYLWRNVMPKIAHDLGMRGIALDLLGFGKSDHRDDVGYTVRLHADIVEAFIEKLDLKNLILVMHDWGGPLGASYAVNHRDNVSGLAFMETFVWPIVWKDLGKFAPVFWLFRSPLGYLMIQVMNLFVNTVLPGSVLHRENVSEEVMRHYREPFPTIGSRKAIRAFQQLLPIAGRPAESDAFIEEIQNKLQSVKFPILWIKATPGAIVSKETEYHLHILQKMLPQLIIKDFGPGLHYLQEDDPAKIADLLTEWVHQFRRGSGGVPMEVNRAA
jgi:haloalkane dehalogenase